MIRQTAMAGTLESSDIMVTVEPWSDGICLQLDSIVEKQFGGQIRKVIADTLMELGVTQVKITAVDRGALDCTIRARIKAAVARARHTAQEARI